MLEMDSVSRTHGVGLAQIEQELAAFQAAATQPIQENPVVGFDPGAHKEVVDLAGASAAPTGPQYIDNPDDYRMKYNPSREGQSNQSQVTQAILCPACSAPLGIPDIRPIKVTCPQCFNETVFNN